MYVLPLGTGCTPQLDLKSPITEKSSLLSTIRAQIHSEGEKTEQDDKGSLELECTDVSENNTTMKVVCEVHAEDVGKMENHEFDLSPEKESDAQSIDDLIAKLDTDIAEEDSAKDEPLDVAEPEANEGARSDRSTSTADLSERKRSPSPTQPESMDVADNIVELEAEKPSVKELSDTEKSGKGPDEVPSQKKSRRKMSSDVKETDCGAKERSISSSLGLSPVESTSDRHGGQNAHTDPVDGVVKTEVQDTTEKEVSTGQESTGHPEVSLRRMSIRMVRVDVTETEGGFKGSSPSTSTVVRQSPRIMDMIEVTAVEKMKTSPVKDSSSKRKSDDSRNEEDRSVTPKKKSVKSPRAGKQRKPDKDSGKDAEKGKMIQTAKTKSSKTSTAIIDVDLKIKEEGQEEVCVTPKKEDLESESKKEDTMTPMNGAKASRSLRAAGRTSQPADSPARTDPPFPSESPKLKDQDLSGHVNVKDCEALPGWKIRTVMRSGASGSSGRSDVYYIG